MADIGYASLVLALIFAAYTAVVSIANTQRKSAALAASARNGLIAVAVFYSLAVEIMLYALLTDDFDVQLVANYSATDVPLIYKLTALYSDKAGSLMFWGWLISILGIVLIFGKRRAFGEVAAQAVGVLAIILVFFLVLIIVPLDAFEESSEMLQALPDGLGRVYQHPAMAIHPPVLFLGYAGFAILFAFGMGALISGRRIEGWIGELRRWALVAWCALGLANLAGAWWAWDVGGWGGYWAWDPVENAGLMPWLVGTALLHSLAMARKRSLMGMWSIIFLVFAFAFTLLSPFITHGGLEDSPLHGFADSPVPVYILTFMVMVLLGSFGLVWWRRQSLSDRRRVSALLSREGAFLMTGILLSVIVAVVLIGTALPGIADDFGKRITIDRDFFDWTAAPALLLLVLLMGICPLLGWRESTPGMLRRNFTFPVLVSAVAALVILIAGVGDWYALAALACGLSLVAIVQEWIRGTRARRRLRGENYAPAFLKLIWGNRPRYGGFIAHIGILLIALGVIGSTKQSSDFMVNLLWTGGGVLFLGALVAFWPGRRLGLSKMRVD